MTDRDTALEMMANVSATAAWLNKLDKLFAVVRDEAVAIASVAQDDNVPSTDDLLAAIDAFRLEFYGDEDGADHPDAAVVSGDPSMLTPEDAESKVRALIEGGIGHLPRSDVAAIVIAYEAARWGDEFLSSMGRQIAATYPDPQPLIILNPDGALDLGYLDEKAMEAAGWVRKNPN